MATKLPPGIRLHGTGLQIRINHNGRQYCKTITTGNPTAAATIAAAVREREDMKSRLHLGLPLYEEEVGQAGLFREVAQDWLNTFSGKLSTIQGYTNILNTHWLPELGNRLIAEIRPSHLKEVLSKKNVSAKTKRNLIGPVRSLMDYAVGEGYITVNPCESVKIGKHQKPAIERFKPEEVEKILAKLDGEALAYFTLFFETGLRPGEILGLQWDDYDGETLHVSRAIVRRRVTSTKTYEVRDVLVSERLRKVLASHSTRFKGGPIFQNSFGRPHLDTDAFNPLWKVALRRAKVRYRIPYTCRHTRASMLLTAGVEPAFAAKQMGHTIEMFFRIYADWIDEQRGTEQRDIVLSIGQGVGQKLARETKKSGK